MYLAQVKRGLDQEGAGQECLGGGPGEPDDLFPYIARYMTLVPVAASRFRGATSGQCHYGHSTQSQGQQVKTSGLARLNRLDELIVAGQSWFKKDNQVVGKCLRSKLAGVFCVVEWGVFW